MNDGGLGRVPSPNEMLLNGRRIQRHHTDAGVYSPKSHLDNEVIIEDEDRIITVPSQAKLKPTKKSVLVTRHKTDILTQRPQSTPLQPNQKFVDAVTTRRSVSRQGSRIQQGSRMQTVTEEEYTTQNVLQSQIQDEKQVAKIREMTTTARQLLGRHKEKVQSFNKARKTRAFHAAMQIIEAKKCILISGKLGSGKSHTALEIMETLLEEHTNFEPLIVRSPFELSVLENSSREVIVLIENCFGISHSEQILICGWRRIEKLAKSLLERHQVYFILTSENNTYEAAMDIENGPGIPFVRDITRVDLEANTFSLTTKEQVTLLQTVCTQQDKLNSMNDQLFDLCKEFESQMLGFPLVGTFVGLHDTRSLFQDPFQCLCEFIADKRTSDFASYMFLVLVLFMEEKFPVGGLSNTEKTLFLKLLEVFSPMKCSYAEAMDAMDGLFQMNLIAKDADPSFVKFSHRFVYLAVLHDVSHCKFEDLLDVLPISALNTIDLHVSKLDGSQQSRQAGNENINIVINISKFHCNIIASKFSSSLESKKPEVFSLIASSELWTNGQFVEIVQNMLGFQLFFLEDKNQIPLSAYLIRSGHSELLANIFEKISNSQSNMLSGIQKQIIKTVEEAIKTKQMSSVSWYITSYNGNDSSIYLAAIENGDKEMIELVSQSSSFHNLVSALIPPACACDNIDILRYLLSRIDQKEASVVIRKKDVQGRSLLHMAAKGGNIETFDFLVGLALDIRAQTKIGLTVLDVAAIYGNLKLVKHIVSLVPDMLEMTDDHGFTVAHFAAREGHLDILKYVVEKGASATLKIQGGNTIFHLAAFNGHLSILDFLMDTYPGISKLQNDDPFMPVHLAAKAGQIETIDFFLRRGTEPSIQTVDGRSLLHLAAFNGNLQLVQYLCHRYPDMCKNVDQDGNTLAHDASASGNVPVLSYLIENHIDPMVSSKDGCTLLHEACYYGRTEVVKYLAVKYPKMLNIRSQNGYTCCHAAALGGFVEILDYLIRNNADPVALSEDGSTILHEAAFSGKEEMVKFICKSCPDMLFIGNVRSYMPIHFAAQEGHLDIMIHLLSIGKELIPETSEDQTILHIAAYNGRMNIVRYICDSYTGMVCKKDANGATATHYAARGGYIDILDFLLSKGLDPCAVTMSGSTVLHLAGHDGKLEMTKHLCNKYPELIDRLDETGHNAAHYSAGSGNLELLKFLLSQGIKPTAQTSNGSTLLLKAAFSGKLNIVQFLCNTFPDMIGVADEFGCNALHYSACGGHIELMQFLCTQGLDPFTKTKDGHTLMHIAAYHGQLAVVKFLCQEYPDLRNVTDAAGQTPDKFAQLGEQNEVLKFFKKGKKQSMLIEMMPEIGDDCGTSVRLAFTRACGFLGAMVCCCRRSE